MCLKIMHENASAPQNAGGRFHQYCDKNTLNDHEIRHETIFWFYLRSTEHKQYIFTPDTPIGYSGVLLSP